MARRVALIWLVVLVPWTASGAGIGEVMGDPLVPVLRASLAHGADPADPEMLDWQRLRAFYTKRDFLPVWVNRKGPTARAREFATVMLHADSEGLDAAEYHAPEIELQWTRRGIKALARLELLLTDAFFRYAVEVRVGYQFPRAVDVEWFIDPPTVDPVELLTQVLAGDFDAAMDDLAPPHPGYQRLRTALRDYTANAAGGDWPRVPPGPNLRLGDRNPRVPALRERLAREGFATAAVPDPQLFDRDLEEAVRRVQYRYGHTPDGIVGYNTRMSLNVALPERINQIKRNMERWRWLPRDLGERYLEVNMAGYKLHLIERGRTALEMRVIIGKPYQATPAFTDRVRYLEINPYWNIPPRIAREDLLPKQQADAGYFRKKRIRVLSGWGNDAVELDDGLIDWSSLNENFFPFKLQQPPGEDNSLGRIKFMFPNRFKIYLHDTPHRDLFNRKVRTFSSGCIRLERPVTLAEHLLKGTNAWTKEQLRAAIRTGTNQQVILPSPVPIYLLYWTAWVEEDGSVHFRNDIYERDKNIAVRAPALAARAPLAQN